jgi:hypothetical protein
LAPMRFPLLALPLCQGNIRPALTSGNPPRAPVYAVNIYVYFNSIIAPKAD